MPITAPPTAPSIADPIHFAPEADAWLEYWAVATTDLNALEVNVVAKEASAAGHDTAAAASQVAAYTSANDAANALAAALALPVTPATSNTNTNVVAAGNNKTLDLIEMGKGFGIGNAVKFTVAADITKWMIGTVSAFNPGPGGVNPGRMTIAVTSSNGASGTNYNAWSVTQNPGTATTVGDITDYVTDQAARKAVIEADITTVANRVSVLEAGTETINIAAIVAGVLTIDLGLAHTDFKISTTANITSIVFTNPPAAGVKKNFVLRFAFGGVARTITWPGLFKHFGGSAPVFSYTNGKEGVISCYTEDATTAIRGAFVGEA
jgi:hypothetical protein